MGTLDDRSVQCLGPSSTRTDQPLGRLTRIEKRGGSGFNQGSASMSEKTAAFVGTHGLGRLDGQLPLRGKLPVAGAGLVKAELCWTPLGLWIVAAESDSRGEALSLLECADFRYQRRALGDKITVKDTVFGVSRARSSNLTSP